MAILRLPTPRKPPKSMTAARASPLRSTMTSTTRPISSSVALRTALPRMPRTFWLSRATVWRWARQAAGLQIIAPIPILDPDNFSRRRRDRCVAKTGQQVGCNRETCARKQKNAAGRCQRRDDPGESAHGTLPRCERTANRDNRVRKHTFQVCCMSVRIEREKQPDTGVGTCGTGFDLGRVRRTARRKPASFPESARYRARPRL